MRLPSRRRPPAPAPGAAPLEALVDGLSATPPSPLAYQPDVVVRSFLLHRPAGGVLVYNSPGLSAAAVSIRDAGGATRLLLGHGHEAMHGEPALDVPVLVHERDRRETAQSMRVAGVFTGPEVIDDDLEVIPTPGHTPGATSYLWDSGRHRFLFTGDSVWIEHGEWKAVVLDPRARAQYVRSLRLVRELDFDVLVPWGVSQGEPPFALVDRAEARSRLDAVIARVEAGSDR